MIVSSQYLEGISKRKVTFTLDKRVTGSHIIDESLQVRLCQSIGAIVSEVEIFSFEISLINVIAFASQEILDFILRDYVEPWYGILSDDEEFTKSVRDTAQKIAINIANRLILTHFLKQY